MESFQAVILWKGIGATERTEMDLEGQRERRWSSKVAKKAE